MRGLRECQIGSLPNADKAEVGKAKHLQRTSIHGRGRSGRKHKYRSNLLVTLVMMHDHQDAWTCVDCVPPIDRDQSICILLVHGISIIVPHVFSGTARAFNGLQARDVC